jgi:glutamyl-Q tRNA(Asp) synthetase
LHFGSLIAATASYLETRCAGGEWLVRIEDIDEPRTVAGSEKQILASLHAHGFRFDGETVRQRERKPLYQAALEKLKTAGIAYPCGCSRKEVGDWYPGTCRTSLPPGRSARAWRVRVPAAPISFTDYVQGEQQEALEASCGDFVVLRADGCFAYQLAVVVDDAEQSVTHVVRGADLLDSTCRQIFLQRALGLNTPAYLHVPVALNENGEKLSKQTLAPAIDACAAAANLVRALRFLGQDPSPALANESLERIWAWAIANWDAGRIPKMPGIQTES